MATAGLTVARQDSFPVSSILGTERDSFPVSSTLDTERESTISATSIGDAPDAAGTAGKVNWLLFSFLLIFAVAPAFIYLALVNTSGVGQDRDIENLASKGKGLPKLGEVVEGASYQSQEEVLSGFEHTASFTLADGGPFVDFKSGQSSQEDTSEGRVLQGFSSSYRSTGPKQALLKIGGEKILPQENVFEVTSKALKRLAGKREDLPFDDPTDTNPLTFVQFCLGNGILVPMVDAQETLDMMSKGGFHPELNPETHKVEVTSERAGKFHIHSEQILDLVKDSNSAIRSKVKVIQRVDIEDQGDGPCKVTWNREFIPVE